MFVAAAAVLAVAGAPSYVPPLGLTAGLVGLYAIFSCAIKIPVGAGSVVPSWLVLVPMLVLLPPALVPALAALGLVLGTTTQHVARRARGEQIVFSIADAWHTLGPAVVLTVTGRPHSAVQGMLVYGGAFAAGCVVDVVSAIIREWLSEEVAPHPRMHVILVGWAIDACIAPVGLLVAYSVQSHPAQLVLLLPLGALLLFFQRDRQALLARSRQRLHQAVDERQRLHRAAQRVADALAARVDFGALTTVVLDTATDIFAADAGSLVFDDELRTVRRVPADSEHLVPLLDAAEAAAWTNGSPYRLESGGDCAVAVPAICDGRMRGVLTIARPTQFTEAEQAALSAFAARVAQAGEEVTAYAELRHQAETDPLTGLGNRRRLTEDLVHWLAIATPEAPVRLTLLDLDKFKAYNDLFGHLAGDALLTSLAGQLADAVAPAARAYRLGGDEFCVVRAGAGADADEVEAAAEALTERTTSCEIRPSWGSVLLPQEARTVEEALGLADERMYAHKRSVPAGPPPEVLTEFLPGS